MRRALAFLLVLSTALSLYAAPEAEGARFDLAYGLPEGLVSPGFATFAGSLYLFGGRVPDEPCFNAEGVSVPQPRFTSEIRRVDLATGATTTLANLPRVGSGAGGREAPATVALNGKIYAFGGAIVTDPGDVDGDGCNDRRIGALGDVVEFDPETSAVRVLAESFPLAFWGSAAVAHGNEALIFGGVAINREGFAEQMDWIWSFDPSRPEGARLEELPETLPLPLQDPAGVAVGGRTYLFAGLGRPANGTLDCGDLPYCLSDRIVVHDRLLRSARLLPARFPRPLQFPSAAELDGSIYVLGGRNIFGTGSAGAFQFSPENETLVPLVPPLPGGRYGAATTVSEGKIVLLGGKLNATTYWRNGVVFDPRPSAPWAPEALDANLVTSEGATLAWTPPGYDGGAAVTGYQLYRARLGEPFARIADLPESARSYLDRTADAGTTYNYIVTALNAVSESGTGAQVRLTTLVAPPGAPQALAAYAGEGAALLRWLPPGKNGGAAILHYGVYRDGSIVARVNASPAPQFLDTGLSNGREYAYRVTAVNARGEGAPAGPAVVIPAPVPAPPGATTATVEGGTVRLGWDASPDAVVGYRIYRASEGESARCLPAEVTPCVVHDGTSYTDAAAEAGRVYRYHVTAVSATGESLPTPWVSAVLLTEPSPPRNFTATAGPLRAVLRWDAPERSGGGTLTFVVVREGGNATTRSETSATSFVDTNVSAGLRYTYAVFAKNPLAGARTADRSVVPTDANARPVARLSADPVDAIPGRPVRFDASLSSDEDGRVVEFGFDFGDGGGIRWLASPVARHAYLAGSYNATLVVKDDAGEVSDSVAITITAGSASGRSSPPGLDRPGGAPGRGVPALSFLAALAAVAILAQGARRPRA